MMIHNQDAQVAEEKKKQKKTSAEVTNKRPRHVMGAVVRSRPAPTTLFIWGPWSPP